MKPPPSRRFSLSFPRRAWIGAGFVLLLGIAAGAAHRALIALDAGLPSLSDVRRPPLAFTTIVYAADGQELARYFRQNRTWVTLERVSPHVTGALVATEDHRFYTHSGVDGLRLASAAWQTLRGRPQGASTIPMQLARNLFEEIGRERSLTRKLREMRAARQLERQHTKGEILELYLNTVDFGMGAFGIEAAARTYFGKGAGALDVHEAALLVGLLKGTTRYNPVRHPQRARRRRDVVLGRMLRHGMLSPAEHERATRAPIRLDVRRPARIGDLAPHFAEHARVFVEAWAEAHGYDLHTDGLRIHTTLDPRLQALAQAALREQAEGLHAVAGYEWSRRSAPLLSTSPAPYRRRAATGVDEPFAYFWNAHPDLLGEYLRRTSGYRQRVAHGTPPDSALAVLLADRPFMDSLKAEKTRLEAGLVALDPWTGHVKAWVGGRDFVRDQYDKVARARRQPGSTFKPFVYAAALEAGWAPHGFVGGTPRGDVWRPRNSGGTAGDSLTLHDALAFSKNTAAARLIAEVGPREVARLARRVGIKSLLNPVPSLALGTSEVTLLELTSAYGAFAAQGIYRAPVVVTRIESRTGRVLWTSEPEAYRALSRYTAYATLDMLRSAVDYGTGAEIRRLLGPDLDLAGKTGTSQGAADGWFLLAHPQLVAGVWVGFNDRRLTFRSDHWGQGARTALPIAGDFLRRLQHSEAPLRPVRFRMPPGYRPDTLRAPHAAPPLHAKTPPLPDAFAQGLRRPAPSDEATLPGADVEQALRQAAASSGAGSVGPGRRE